METLTAHSKSLPSGEGGRRVLIDLVMTALAHCYWCVVCISAVSSFGLNILTLSVILHAELQTSVFISVRFIQAQWCSESKANVGMLKCEQCLCSHANSSRHVRYHSLVCQQNASIC